MAKLKVSQFGMTMHMNLGKGCHSYMYSGYIDQPGHELHGKKIFNSKYSEKGKAQESKWSVDDGAKEPNWFNSLLLLMDHYKLKPIPE